MNLLLLYLLPFFSAAAISGAILLFLKHIAPKIKLIDTPGGRKKHKGDIPLIGGLAILVGFFFTCLLFPSPLFIYKPLFACMILITFLGLADDFQELSPRIRLLGQMSIVLLAIFWGNIKLSDLGNLFFQGNIHFGMIGTLIFTVLAWLSFVNASNMQDGADGLAGSIAVIQISFLLFLAISKHAEVDARLLSIFLGTLIVFLWFNFPLPGRRAKIFMGDAGSLLLGFFIAWFAISFSQQSNTFPSPVTFLWITAVPLLDFFAVTIGRIRHKQSPLKADRRHLHHFLETKGYSSFQIVIQISLLSITFSIIGLLLFYLHLSDGLSFVFFSCLLIIYVLFFLKKT